MFPPRGRGIGQLGEALALPEPKQLTAATWRLVLALLMCAVLFCVIRARLSDHIPLTSGHQTRPRQVVLAAVLVRVCAGLFIVGLAVRFIRWFWDRSEEHTSELQSRGLISYAVFCL